MTAVIYVCALNLVASKAAEMRPSHVLSLLGGITPFPVTPRGVRETDHLKMLVADICEPEEGMITPHTDHMREVIAFGQRWHRETKGDRPILVHCFAGISRSTASALALACALRPDVPEREFTTAIRKASPSAQPNRLMVAHADELLGRNGRLVDAVEDMGLAELTSSGVPFALPLGRR